MSDVTLSKWMSLVLRHDPEGAGLTMDGNGWIEIEALCAAAPLPLDRQRLARIVAENSKKRFAISADGARIRARQGHSIPVDLGLSPQEPPETLFHGTATRVLEVILREGLRPMGRHHVHLSADPDTARQVGLRHGRPVVLTTAARDMVRAGHSFFRSENGVWLTDHVPPSYLSAAP